MALSPPRTPAWSAPGHPAQLGIAEQNAPIHRRSGSGLEREQTAEHLGHTAPRPGRRHVQDARPLDRPAGLVNRLYSAASGGRGVVAGRPRGHRHRLEVRRHGRAAYFRSRRRGRPRGV